MKMFEEALTDPSADFRFWGTVGFAQLARCGKINKAPEALESLLNDTNPYVAAEAAYAISYMGQPEKGIEFMLRPKVEENRKIGYSVLECLSLDRDMRPIICRYLPELKSAAETLPRKNNEDAGFMARGILVNIGQLDIDLLHGEEVYDEGLKLNKGRRKMRPTP